MNYLEKIASEVKSTPQVLWFKKRYTPLMSTFLKLVEDGVIKYSEFHNPLIDMFGYTVLTFRYDGNRYVFSFAKRGGVMDWYKLEKISPNSSSLRGTMVSSSDDDPNQESIMETVAMMLNANTPNDFYNKLEAVN